MRHVANASQQVTNSSQRLPEILCQFKSLFTIPALIFVCVGVFSLELFAQQNSPAKKWVEKQGAEGSRLGFWAYDLKEDRLIATHQEKKLMRPASISKIVTAAAILKEFPVNHQFETQLKTMASQSGETLRGDLYFVGGGDPSFISERMWFLVNEFRRTGIRKIQGDLLVDDSAFDAIRYDEDREDKRVDRAYDAPIGALSFNWNSVSVFVRPGSSAGSPAQVWIDPENTYIQVINHATTAAAGKGKSIEVSREKKADGDQITVRGQIAVNHEEVVVYKSITQPELWAGTNLVQFLKEKGVEISGKVKKGTAPASAKLLAKSPGAPISQMTSDMLKFSNNYIAEMLTKSLDLKKGTRPATMRGGISQIQSFLKSLRLADSDIKFVNPSGLTMDNMMTPEALGKVLLSISKNFQTSPEFFTGLPIGGSDGTLKNRFKGSLGAIRAKTGLMKQAGIVSLAGFAQNKSGHPIAFVVMYNSPGEVRDVWKVWGLVDQLTEQILRD